MGSTPAECRALALGRSERFGGSYTPFATPPSLSKVDSEAGRLWTGQVGPSVLSPSGSSGHMTPNLSAGNLTEDGFVEAVQTAEEEAEGRDGTVKSSIFNLICTVIGGGVLSLPYTCHRCGVVLAPILLMAISGMSAYSAMLLLSSSRRVTKRKRGETSNCAAESYEDVVYAAFGPCAKLCLTGMVLCLTFLAAIAYLILLADLLVPVLVLALQDSFGWVCTASESEKRFYVIFICATLVLPAQLPKDISALRYTSLLSMMSISTLGVAIAIEASKSKFGHREPSWFKGPWLYPELYNRVRLFPDDLSGLLESISIMSCAFMCHFNVLPLHRALREPSRKRLKVMIYVTMASVWVFYAIISVFAYLEFRDTICDNLLKNYDHNKFSFILVGQCGLSCSLIFSLPLITRPCRACVENLLSKGKQPEFPWYIVLIESILIVFSAAFIASRVTSVVTVWNFLGSTVSITIGFIAPAACYLRLREPTPDSATFVEAHAPPRLEETESLSVILSQSQSKPVQRRGITEDLNRYRLPAFCLLILGILLLIACTTQSIISVVSTTKHSYCRESLVQCSGHGHHRP